MNDSLVEKLGKIEIKICMATACLRGGAYLDTVAREDCARWLDEGRQLVRKLIEERRG